MKTAELSNFDTVNNVNKEQLLVHVEDMLSYTMDQNILSYPAPITMHALQVDKRNIIPWACKSS